jgi:folylpolyglutamate synthase
VRERIQINNEPISEDQFAKYFFEVWDRLEDAAKTLKTPPGERTKPVYFRLLTMVALHTYMREGVDTAVLECGVGGHYDSTNIIVHPTVTAVTSLGIDHVAMLGSTLPEIAWHKGGIFKPDTLALTAPQKPEAIEVLKERAAEKGNELHIVRTHPSLASGEVKLGLSASFQKINASVAIAAAAAHLRTMGQTDISDPTSTDMPLPDEFKRALQDTRWPGRCEIRREKNIAWHIDGGHTKESIAETAKWFAEQITESTGARISEQRILIFNQQTRDANALAKVLHDALVDGVHASKSPLAKASTVFTHVIFTNNKTFNEGFSPDLVSINTNALDVESLAVQNELAKAWNDLDPHPTISIRASIEDALQDARRMAREWTKASSDVEVPVLVTGSIHLVGGAIEVLETGRADMEAEPKTGNFFQRASGAELSTTP